MSRPRRVLVAAVTVPVLAVAVLAAEVGLARRGAVLDAPPLDFAGRVGEGPGVAIEVVWLGDSTAVGVGASDAHAALPTLVAEGLGRAVELSVVAGSGATVAEVVERQVPALAGVEPDVVFVSVGANDVTHFNSRAEVERDYRRLVAGLAGDAQVVLLGVPDMGAIPRLAQPLRAVAGWRGSQLDEVVRRVAHDTGSAYVDIAGATGSAFRADPERYFAGDGFHPSDAGYRLWARAVLDEVNAVLA